MTTPYLTRTTNVLVIGSGGAGLRAAIAAAATGADVLIVGKRPRRDAHTVLAAGGINAALGSRDPEDSPEQHFADTYRDGYALAVPRTRGLDRGPIAGFRALQEPRPAYYDAPYYGAPMSVLLFSYLVERGVRDVHDVRVRRTTR